MRRIFDRITVSSCRSLFKTLYAQRKLKFCRTKENLLCRLLVTSFVCCFFRADETRKIQKYQERERTLPTSTISQSHTREEEEEEEEEQVCCESVQKRERDRKREENNVQHSASLDDGDDDEIVCVRRRRRRDKQQKNSFLFEHTFNEQQHFLQ